MIMQICIFDVPIGELFALPEGESVRHGEVSIERDGDKMIVYQESGRAIVNYKSFNIDQPETVEFRQPDGGSKILNRVTGGGSSTIAGSMLSNGQVYLINTAGILFTSSARVNVAGLVASAMNMSDGDFLNGRNFFSGGGGSVVNKGSLKGNYVYLVGGSVKNKGSIKAGEAVLASGNDSVLIEHVAGGEIRLVIDGREIGPDGKPVKSSDAEASDSASEKEAAKDKKEDGEESGTDESSSAKATEDGESTTDATKDKTEDGESTETEEKESEEKDGSSEDVGAIQESPEKETTDDSGGKNEETTDEESKENESTSNEPVGAQDLDPDEKTTDIESKEDEPFEVNGDVGYWTGSGGGGVSFTDNNKETSDAAGDISENNQGQSLNPTGNKIEEISTEIENEIGTIINEGIIDVTGAEGGTIVIGGTNIEQLGEIIADGTGGDGGIIKIAAAEGLTIGEESITSAVSEELGSGGEIVLTGKEIEVLGGALIDASGEEGGGSIKIGGGYQGKDETVPNATNVVIEKGVEILADAKESGNGGTVIAWADEVMEFYGDISARALGKTGDGGFAEVSGAEELYFDGTADLSSINGRTGTLLLDPLDIIVATAGGSITPATIITLLAGTHLVIHTRDTLTADNGDITISDDINYNSSNSLTFLATRNFYGSSDIVNDGDGALNIVAGWDEVTPSAYTNTITANPGGAFNIAAILGDTNSYGNNNGSIIIGDGTQSESIAIGSKDGTTTLAGYDLLIQAGNTASDYAQIGYHGAAATGDIYVQMKNDVTATGGTDILAPAQIGHGGVFVGGDKTGDITVNAQNIVFEAGNAQSSYAQLGHGGYSADGDSTGTIEVSAAGNITFMSGTGSYTYTQLGHGGLDADGTQTGAIIVSGQDITFSAGASDNTYAQLGHGGYLTTNFPIEGDITVTAQNVIFNGGTGLGAYAQLGSGGHTSDCDVSGTIYVDASANIAFLSGTGDYAYTHLGNGGYDADATQVGNIIVN
ncbi:filamentous hemagglutinin N-terminal domain-containing protein [Chlamydiota bacterium]